ncbi:Hypothetical predicted protein [Lecanosticta acicola]|uniref:37S ribosomal protein mrp10, mitochondrial n=1 Tax=Lecanosticta acicola TaxID=111012 RepID=A0AAI9EAZ2_9PEZI|nr:Hypothetical predicted protein [Lecanosticta acicola]
MVAGKNTPASLSRAATQANPKLPPLPKLRVRKPDRAAANPCLTIMSTMLGETQPREENESDNERANVRSQGCWASSGYTTAGCAALEQQLRACMDARKGGETQKSPINHYLSRFYPQIIGPHKRK